MKVSPLSLVSSYTDSISSFRLVPHIQLGSWFQSRPPENHRRGGRREELDVISHGAPPPLHVQRARLGAAPEPALPLCLNCHQQTRCSLKGPGVCIRGAAVPRLGRSVGNPPDFNPQECAQRILSDCSGAVMVVSVYGTLGTRLCVECPARWMTPLKGLQHPREGNWRNGATVGGEVHVSRVMLPDLQEETDEGQIRLVLVEESRLLMVPVQQEALIV